MANSARTTPSAIPNSGAIHKLPFAYWRSRNAEDQDITLRMPLPFPSRYGHGMAMHGCAQGTAPVVQPLDSFTDSFIRTDGTFLRRLEE